MPNLKRTVAGVLVGVAVLGASSQAVALSLNDLGQLGEGGLSANWQTSLYAWDGLHPCAGVNVGFGCGDQSHWYSFNTSGGTDVSVSTVKSLSGSPLNTAFSIWKTNGSFNPLNHFDHGYNQVRADGGSLWLQAGYYSRDIQDPAITDGVTEFVGYANSGPTGWANPDGDIIGIGSGGTVNVSDGNASLLLSDLAAGQYLIAVGGSCHLGVGSNPCGSGSGGPSTISINQVSAVPISPAFWLMGSGLLALSPRLRKPQEAVSA